MTQPIAVLCAMEQEMRSIEAALADPAESTQYGQRFVAGTVSGVPLITAVSGYGKVASAATTATIIERFKPSQIVFGGVAGGVGSSVRIGDIVVADRLVQYDYDASPLFDRFVIPALGVAEIIADPELTERLRQASMRFTRSGAANDPVAGLDITKTSVHVGLIASGDRFIDDTDETTALANDLPGLLAVEMEGAAVAQVCAARDVPFGVFRSISDRADNTANVDFASFVSSVAAPVTAGVVIEMLRHLS